MKQHRMRIRAVSIFFVWMLVCAVFVGMLNVVGNTEAAGLEMDMDLEDSLTSFFGEYASDFSGYSVAGAGDVNGDEILEEVLKVVEKKL